MVNTVGPIPPAKADAEYHPYRDTHRDAAPVPQQQLHHSGEMRNSGPHSNMRNKAGLQRRCLQLLSSPH